MGLITDLDDLIDTTNVTEERIEKRRGPRMKRAVEKKRFKRREVGNLDDWASDVAARAADEAISNDPSNRELWSMVRREVYESALKELSWTVV